MAKNFQPSVKSISNYITLLRSLTVASLAFTLHYSKFSKMDDFCPSI